MTLFFASTLPFSGPAPTPVGPIADTFEWWVPTVASPVAAADDDEDDELGDEEDLSIAQPPVEEDSAFDDFDDEFDDDFEEEENDPDWDHPEDGDSDEPPPAKGPGRKK